MAAPSVWRSEQPDPATVKVPTTSPETAPKSLRLNYIRGLDSDWDGIVVST
jgi:hypothetical protein